MRTDDFSARRPAADGAGRTATDTGVAVAQPQNCTSGPASLVRTIEGEMIPRLLMLYRQATAEHVDAKIPDGLLEARQLSNGVEACDVEELARLLVAHGRNIAREFVEAVRQRGIPYDSICVGLLAPTARRLAEQWEIQRIGNSELALGLDGLSAVVLDVGDAAKRDRSVSLGS